MFWVFESTYMCEQIPNKQVHIRNCCTNDRRTSESSFANCNFHTYHKQWKTGQQPQPAPSVALILWIMDIYAYLCNYNFPCWYNRYLNYLIFSLQVVKLTAKKIYPFLFQKAKCIKNYIRNDVHIVLKRGLHKCLVLAAKVAKICLLASPGMSVSLSQCNIWESFNGFLRNLIRWIFYCYLLLIAAEHLFLYAHRAYLIKYIPKRKNKSSKRKL